MMTNSLYVDTSGWASLLIPGELYAQQAISIYRGAYSDLGTKIYTSDHVLAELVALANARRVPRSKVLSDIDSILFDPRHILLFTDRQSYYDAWDLLKQRTDKQWSLVDAISLVWMGRYSISEALTSDHHFEQAGFIRLLK